MNLVTNARDALNERYPDYDENKTIRVSASTSKKDGANWIRLSIEDQGAGIPDDVVPRIFDPFYTTKNSSGIGLSICKRIIKDHNGILEVHKSDYLGGAQFIIYLPV